jgi:CheY-like chemotaxis protein
MSDTVDTPDFIQQQRLALVCEGAPERQGVIKAALDQIGFTMHAARNAEEAVERLRRDSYELVIVDERFQGSTPLDNVVLAALHGMPMSGRRYIFVALLGREYKTFDNMMAFARSVNVVVNPNDLPHLPAILVKAMNDNNQFYRVFREVLAEAGKR